MKFAKFAAAAAALSLATAPAIAAPERATAPAAEESEIGGQAGILVLFAIIAVVLGVAIGGGGDDPVSA